MDEQIKKTDTISKKDYSEGRVKGGSWLNFVLNTRCGTKWVKDGIRRITKARFAQTNKGNFTKLFGKHNFVFDGEVRYYVWELEFKGVKILAFTDADSSYKGTTYEIMVDEVPGKESEKTGKLAVEFAEVMCDMISRVTSSPRKS
jgi:hypothetical protein